MAESAGKELSTLSLRPIMDDDQPRLLLIYASTRIEEMRALDWSPQQRGQFLRQQFDAQHADYQERFPNASFDLVLQDDQPVGRLYVDRRPGEIRIVDIAILPEFRGQGIGSRLMHDLLTEAWQQQLPVRIHVASNNHRARALYQRLGLTDERAEGDALHQLMQWNPDDHADGEASVPCRCGS